MHVCLKRVGQQVIGGAGSNKHYEMSEHRAHENQSSVPSSSYMKLNVFSDNDPFCWDKITHRVRRCEIVSL